MTRIVLLHVLALFLSASVGLSAQVASPERPQVQDNVLAFDVRIDFIKAPAAETLVAVTFQIPNRELTFVNKDDLMHSTVSIFGRFTSASGKPERTFEAPLQLDIPANLIDNVRNYISLGWNAVSLAPGRYRLDIIIEDVNGAKYGRFGQDIQVPDFDDGKLSSSSLVLADALQEVPLTQAGVGDFVIGTDKVRPKVQSGGQTITFGQSQKVNFWMQVYNLTVDRKTQRSAATVRYQIVDSDTGKASVDFSESTDQMDNNGSQLTLKKSLPPGRIKPGVYRVTITVTDLISKQIISPTATFSVE